MWKINCVSVKLLAGLIVGPVKLHVMEIINDGAAETRVWSKNVTAMWQRQQPT